MGVTIRMKLSNKEKMMLAILGVLLVGTSYYQFIYTNQKEKIDNLKIARDEIETRYNEVMETINTLEERKEKVSNKVSGINLKSKEFYPTIIQEKLILDLDTFLKQSTLNGDIGFSEVTVEAVQVLANNNTENNKSSFEGIVNQYKGTSSQVDDNSSQDITNTQNEEQATSTESSEATVELLKASINFKGSYDAVKSFISKIETSNRQILITDISSTVGYNGELTGTINLEFYAIPKISERDSEYLQWSIEGSYGKEIPFLIQKPEVTVQSTTKTESSSTNSSTANSNNNSSSNTTQESVEDFVAIVKSITSDLPTVIIGKANDTNQDTYIKVVKNNVEKAQIELSKKNDKYYYKYENSAEKYPSDQGGNGIEFLPKSDRIIISINSESRVNADDRSGLELNIVNSTDKIVEVQITGDDKTNPRVTITGDKSKITVTGK